MTLDAIFSALQSLMVVTIINFIVVTGATIGILYTIDKIKEKKEKDKAE
jgi:uncharacterized membrane protein